MNASNNFYTFKRLREDKGVIFAWLSVEKRLIAILAENSQTSYDNNDDIKYSKAIDLGSFMWYFDTSALISVIIVETSGFR